MKLKTILRGMFQHEKPIGFKHVLCKNKIRYLRQLFQLVRRIGKNHIELRVTTVYKLENIRSHQRQIINLQFSTHLANKSTVTLILLNTDNAVAVARNKLHSYPTRSCKQIKHINAFEIDPVVQQIKQTLFGKIGCRACRDITWRTNSTSLIFSTNNSHRNSI